MSMAESPKRAGRSADWSVLRPLFCDPAAERGVRLAGGWTWFDQVAVRRFGEKRERRRSDLDALQRDAPHHWQGLVAPRPDLLGLSLGQPRIMGVLNITPDSFSDGGRHFEASAAVEAGLAMVEAGADLLDIGGESTRPGAEPVPLGRELERVLPVIEGLRAAAPEAILSIDTRRPVAARAAFEAGARIYNDVSALSYDPRSLETAADLAVRYGGAVCLMHAQGDPRTMQDDPRYEDVLAEVAEFLETRRLAAIEAGVPKQNIIVDPGIGFGKALAHNIALMNGLGALHAIGAPLLLGVSRKRFIGALSGETAAERRAPGSIAAALHGLAQGVQILRVHDVAETLQAVRVWRGLQTAFGDGAESEP